MTPGDMMAGWTTVGSRAEAERLARGLVEARLATCTQICGPITSFYRWKGEIESAEEFRLTVKFPSAKSQDVAKWLAEHHPYETPQWLACRVDEASEKYLKWVLEDRS